MSIVLSRSISYLVILVTLLFFENDFYNTTTYQDMDVSG